MEISDASHIYHSLYFPSFVNNKGKIISLVQHGMITATMMIMMNTLPTYN
jgi:hypothetical protein